MFSNNLEPLYTDYEGAGGATTMGKSVWGLDMSLGSYSTCLAFEFNTHHWREEKLVPQKLYRIITLPSSTPTQN